MKSLTLAIVCLFIISGCGQQHSETTTTQKSSSVVEGAKEKLQQQQQQQPPSQPQQPDSSQDWKDNMESMDIMPLAIGNEWTYQLYMYDTLSRTMNKINTATYSVTADSTIDSETWYRIDGMGPHATWGTNRDDGFWIIGPTGEPMLLAKFPGETGDEFTRITGRITIINRIETAGVPVTVPAGSYQCFKYAQEFGRADRVTFSYYAPGYGLIKMEIMNEIGTNPVMKTELINIKTN